MEKLFWIKFFVFWLPLLDSWSLSFVYDSYLWAFNHLSGFPLNLSQTLFFIWGFVIGYCSSLILGLLSLGFSHAPHILIFEFSLNHIPQRGLPVNEDLKTRWPQLLTDGANPSNGSHYHVLQNQGLKWQSLGPMPVNLAAKGIWRNPLLYPVGNRIHVGHW